MAGDVLALMRTLGHERFAVVGHDRGSYVASRLAMDAPEVVSRVALRMGEENYADFRRAIHDPATVAAMLEDYRAGLGVDRAGRSLHVECAPPRM